MPDPTKGLIRVDVAVTDKSGTPVTGLSEKDFTLFDNNEQQKIVTFQAFNGGIQPASSLEVVLVIDELNMRANVRSGKHGALRGGSRGRDFSPLPRRGSAASHHLYRLTEHGLFATPHTSVDGNELADEMEQGGGSVASGRRRRSPEISARSQRPTMCSNRSLPSDRLLSKSAVDPEESSCSG